MRYLVELREYTDSGDYIENDYTFETRSECIKFERISPKFGRRSG